MTSPLGGLGRRAVRRKVLTVPQLLDCERRRLALWHGLGLDWTLGQVVFERVWASNPRARPILVRPEGVSEILGDVAPTGFWKLSKNGHDRFMDRVLRDGLAGEGALEACRRLQRDLAALGILRRLGELLVDAGHVDRAVVEEYLRPRLDAVDLPAFAFARIAAHNGFVTESQAADGLELAEAIQEDLGVRLPIGQIFFELRLLSRVEVEAILEAQVRVGRLGSADARLRSIGLSEPEEDVVLRRLRAQGVLAEVELERAVELSSRLAEYGLELGPLDVLWATDRLPEGSIRELLDHHRAVLARLSPEAPEISLSLAPSADRLTGRGPSDLPEADFLYGEFAVVAGAVDPLELERAVSVLRRCRNEVGIEYSLGEVLFRLHHREPGRFRRLRQAQLDLSRHLGRPHEIAFRRFGPLELEAIVARLADAAVDPELAAEVERSVEIARVLVELGIVREPAEILYDLGGIGCETIADLVEANRDRDRRLVGGWRPRTRDASRARSLFEVAFGTARTTSGRGSRALGSLAVEKGLLGADRLVEALYVQLRVRELGIVKPFGEILVELGFLTSEALASLLAIQARRAARDGGGSGPPDEVPGGEDAALVRRIEENGIVEEESLRQALRIGGRLKALGLKGTLGEILVRRGDLDQEILDGMLREEARHEDLGAAYRRALGEARASRPAVASPADAPRPGRVAALAAAAFLVASLGAAAALLDPSGHRPVPILYRNPAPAPIEPAVAARSPVPLGFAEPPAPDPTPSPAPWRLDLRAALASMPPSGGAPDGVALRSWPAARPKTMCLVVAGWTPRPEGTELAIALEVEGQVVERRRERVRAAESGPATFATWFGPYSATLPSEVDPDGLLWLPAGRYGVRVETLSGPEALLASSELHVPEGEGALEARRFQERAVREFYSSVREEASRFVASLEDALEAIERGETLDVGARAGSICLAASESRSRLEDFARGAVAVPLGPVFRLLERLHDGIIRLGTELAVARARPGPVPVQLAALREEVRSLDAALRVQLSDGTGSD